MIQPFRLYLVGNLSFVLDIEEGIKYQVKCRLVQFQTFGKLYKYLKIFILPKFKLNLLYATSYPAFSSAKLVFFANKQWFSF